MNNMGKQKKGDKLGAIYDYMSKQKGVKNLPEKDKFISDLRSDETKLSSVHKYMASQKGVANFPDLDTFKADIGFTPEPKAYIPQEEVKKQYGLGDVDPVVIPSAMTSDPSKQASPEEIQRRRTIRSGSITDIVEQGEQQLPPDQDQALEESRGAAIQDGEVETDGLRPVEEDAPVGFAVDQMEDGYMTDQVNMKLTSKQFHQSANLMKQEDVSSVLSLSNQYEWLKDVGKNEDIQAAPFYANNGRYYVSQEIKVDGSVPAPDDIPVQNRDEAWALSENIGSANAKLYEQREQQKKEKDLSDIEKESLADKYFVNVAQDKANALEQQAESLNGDIESVNEEIENMGGAIKELFSSGDTQDVKDNILQLRNKKKQLESQKRQLLVQKDYFDQNATEEYGRIYARLEDASSTLSIMKELNYHRGGNLERAAFNELASEYNDIVEIAKGLDAVLPAAPERAEGFFETAGAYSAKVHEGIAGILNTADDLAMIIGRGLGSDLKEEEYTGLSEAYLRTVGVEDKYGRKSVKELPEGLIFDVTGEMFRFAPEIMVMSAIPTMRLTLIGKGKTALSGFNRVRSTIKGAGRLSKYTMLPEGSMLSGVSVSTSRFGTLLGTQALLADLSDEQKGSLLETINVTSDEYLTGAVMDGVGVLSRRLEGAIRTSGGAFIPAWLAGTTAEAGGFMGYAAADEYMLTGQVSQENLAHSAGMALAFRLNPKSRAALSNTSREISRDILRTFTTTDGRVMRSVMKNVKKSSADLSVEAGRLRDLAEYYRTPTEKKVPMWHKARQSDAAATVFERLAEIKLASESAKKNPERWDAAKEAIDLGIPELTKQVKENMGIVKDTKVDAKLASQLERKLLGKRPEAAKEIAEKVEKPTEELTTKEAPKVETKEAPKAETKEEQPETVEERAPIDAVLNRKARVNKIGDMKLEKPIEGDLYVDGQTVIVEQGNRKYEVGNVSELRGKSLSEAGIEPITSNVKANKDGTFNYKGETLVPREESPTKAINYNKKGEVNGVVMRTPDGKKTRTLRGQDAEDAAYQILLRKAETPSQRNRVNEILEKDYGRELREAEKATQKTADTDTQRGQRETGERRTTEDQKEAVETRKLKVEQQPTKEQRVSEKRTEQAREPFTSKEGVRVEMREGKPVAITKKGEPFKDQTKSRPQRAVEEFKVAGEKEPSGYKAKNNLFVQIENGKPVAVDRSGQKKDNSMAKDAVREYRMSEAEKQRTVKVDAAKKVLSEELGKWANIQKVQGERREKFDTKKVTKALADVIDANIKYMSQKALNTFKDFYKEFKEIVPEISAYPKSYIENIYKREIKGENIKEFTDRDMVNALQKQPAKERESLIREIKERGVEGKVEKEVRGKFDSMVKGLKKGRAWQKAEDIKLIKKGERAQAREEKTKEVKKVLNDFIKENRSQLTQLKGVKVPALSNRIANATSRNIDGVLEYTNKIIHDAQFRNANVEARDSQRNLKKASVTGKEARNLKDFLAEMPLAEEVLSTQFLKDYKRSADAMAGRVPDLYLAKKLVSKYKDQIYESILESQVVEKTPQIKTLKDAQDAVDGISKEIDTAIKTIEGNKDVLPEHIISLQRKLARIKTMVNNSIKFGEVRVEDGVLLPVEKDLGVITKKVNEGLLDNLSENLRKVEQKYKESVIDENATLHKNNIPNTSKHFKGTGRVERREIRKFQEFIVQLSQEKGGLRHLSVTDITDLNAITTQMARYGSFPRKAYELRVSMDTALTADRIESRIITEISKSFNDPKSIVYKRFGKDKINADVIAEIQLMRREGDFGYLLGLEGAHQRYYTEIIKGRHDDMQITLNAMKKEYTEEFENVIGKAYGKNILGILRTRDGISNQRNAEVALAKIGILAENLDHNSNLKANVQVVRDSDVRYRVVDSSGNTRHTAESRNKAIEWRDKNIDSLIKYQDSYLLRTQNIKEDAAAKIDINNKTSEYRRKMIDIAYKQLTKGKGELVIKTREELLSRLTPKERKVYLAGEKMKENTFPMVEAVAARKGTDVYKRTNYHPALLSAGKDGYKNPRDLVDVVDMSSAFVEQGYRPKAGVDITRTGMMNYIDFNYYRMMSRYSHGLFTEYVNAPGVEATLGALNKVHNAEKLKGTDVSDKVSTLMAGIKRATVSRYKYAMASPRAFSKAKMAIIADNWHSSYYDLGSIIRDMQKGTRARFILSPLRTFMAELPANVGKYVGWKPKTDKVNFEKQKMTEAELAKFLEYNKGSLLSMKRKLSRAEILDSEPLKTGLSKASDQLLAFGDNSVARRQWQDVFLREYSNITKDNFSMDAYLGDKVFRLDMQSNVDKAISRANEWYDQQYTPMGQMTQKERLRVAWLKSVTLKPDNNLYNVAIQLQTFNISEAANFWRNTRDIYYGTNNRRGEAWAQTGSMILSMMYYSYASSVAYNLVLAAADEGWDNHYARKIKSMYSWDGLSESLMANGATLLLGGEGSAGTSVMNLAYSGMALGHKMRTGKSPAEVDKTFEVSDQVMRDAIYQNRIHLYGYQGVQNTMEEWLGLANITGAGVADAFDATVTVGEEVSKMIQGAKVDDDGNIIAGDQDPQTSAMLSAMHTMGTMIWRHPVSKDVDKFLKWKAYEERQREPKKGESVEQYVERVSKLDGLAPDDIKKNKEEIEGQYYVRGAHNYHANQVLNKEYLSNFERAWYLAEQNKKEPKKVAEAMDLLSEHGVVTEDLLNKATFFIEHNFEDSEEAEKAYKEKGSSTSGSRRKGGGMSGVPMQ